MMEGMNFAAIDIGTNAARLLIKSLFKFYLITS